MDGPLLWFVNRGTGVVLLAVMTASVTIGILATRGKAGTRLPRFLVQSLHRNLALLTVVLLAVHVVSAVADEYVDIRWWQAVVPVVGSSYQPVALGLGTLALDLIVVVTLTSLLRHRIPFRTWWVVHLTSYLAWGVAVLHGIQIGTDAAEPFMRWTVLVSLGVVAAATAVRLGSLARWARQRRRARLPAPRAEVEAAR